MTNNKLLFTMFCAVLLLAGVDLTAYMSATPGQQPVAALVSGLCLGVFTSLVVNRP